MQQRVEAFTSLDVGLEAFLHLTTWFKASLLPPNDSAQLIRQIRAELAQLDDPVGLAGIFVAIGTV